MLMILLVVLIVFAIVWFSKNGNQRNGEIQHRSTDRSLEILNERYALGEIEDEEYAKKKIELKKSGFLISEND